jgi:hypothetical protein
LLEGGRVPGLRRAEQVGGRQDVLLEKGRELVAGRSAVEGLDGVSDVHLVL